MRRKSSGQNNGGYNNQQRGGGGGGKQRFQQGGGHGHGGQNRPRKNYSGMREKYLQQARDALSAGDRVLAENYFQHAEHCYRMMVEEGYNVRNTQNASNEQGGQPQEAQNQRDDHQRDDHNHNNDDHVEPVATLPAFLTATIEDDRKAEPVQNWEE
ncbi:MAG: DUF4167 domain-containing protein [Rickettsiales bacterium]|nr:DUF4167 domain-containing protein [Rickettsiales bacterium]